MKILMPSWEYPPHVVGGLGRHVYHLAKTLASKGFEITVLTFTDGSSPADEWSEGVHIIRVNPYSMRYPDFISWVHGLNLLMANQVVKMEGFDLIHAHDWLSACAGIAIKHMARKPLVATIHSTEVGRRKNLTNDYERHIHEIEWQLSYEAWHVICCSQYMRWEVSTYLNCPNGKISIIPNGFESKCLGKPTPLDRSDYASAKEKIIIFVGRLVHEKGPQIFIEAASRLNRSDLKFLVIGDGSMRPYLMELAKKFGVAHKTYFLGHVSDGALATLYGWASAAVFPSLYEPFGIVVLEAMGSGVPAIVSRVGGLDEIVEDGVNGIKFEAGSSESLAHAIERIVDNPQLKDKIIKNGIHSLPDYSWDMVAEKTINVYNNVYGEYRKSPWFQK